MGIPQPLLSLFSVVQSVQVLTSCALLVQDMGFSLFD